MSNGIVPVSVDQILKLTSTMHGLVIHKRKIKDVVLVANMLDKLDESVETQAATLLEVTDYTGKLKVVFFRSNLSSKATENLNLIEEQNYYRFFGKVKKDNCCRKVNDNEPYLLCYFVEPLKSLNEISVHMIEVVYSAKSLKKLKLDNSLKQLSNKNMRVSGLNLIESAVLNLICDKENETKDGITLDDICKSKYFNEFDKNSVERALKFLEENEHIFEGKNGYKPTN